MGISKITRNHQVTLPKDLRELKGLNEGDSVLFIIEGEKVNLIKMEKNAIVEAAGLWNKTKETGIDYEKKIRKGWGKRLKRETQ